MCWIGTRLMMFVWSVKHLHDMELNYCLSNAETGLLNLLAVDYRTSAVSFYYIHLQLIEPDKEV